jgi:predicted nucleic acid-binding protein
MVATAYLDTSAAMKLLIRESESDALRNELAHGTRRLVASWLLHTELHCAAGRHPSTIDLGAVTKVLDAVVLVDMTRGDLLSAGTHAPLRSGEAVHLATALRLGVDEILTYDDELAHAAAAAGIAVLAPE